MRLTPRLIGTAAAVATLTLAGLTGLALARLAADDAPNDTAIEYATVAQLADAAGIGECKRVDPNGMDVLQRAACGLHYNVSIYIDHEAAMRGAYTTADVNRSLQRTSEDVITTFVVGPNWSVNCGTHCAEVQARVGGSLVTL